MKKRKNDLIQLGILIVLGVLVILSLTLPQFSQERSRPQPLSLSILIRDSDSSLWTNARLGMEQAADELGAELRFLTLSEANFAQEQQTLFLQEIEDGADAIIVSPADPEALSQALSSLENSCPVIAMESPIEGASGLIAPDDDLLGRELAQALLEDWTGGTVLLLDTAGPRTAISRRLQSAQETLSAAGVPTVTRTTVSQAVTSVLNGLLAETGSSYVMTFEASATLAAAQGSEYWSISPALYGVGSSSAITTRLDSGIITAVAAWSDYAAGYLAVEQCVSEVLEHQTAPDPLTFFILRGEDIYEPKNQKLLFPVIS